MSVNERLNGIVNDIDFVDNRVCFSMHFWITTSETCMHDSGLQHLRHVCMFLDYNIWDMYAYFWITTSETRMHIDSKLEDVDVSSMFQAIVSY